MSQGYRGEKTTVGYVERKLRGGDIDGTKKVGNCSACGEEILGNAIRVDGMLFHPSGCFRCENCGKELQKDSFFKAEGEKGSYLCEDCILTITITDRDGKKFTAYTPYLSKNLPSYISPMRPKK